jgi:hypothetical protein
MSTPQSLGTERFGLSVPYQTTVFQMHSIIPGSAKTAMSGVANVSVSIQLFGADGTARSKKGLFTTKAQRRKEYSFTPYSLCVGVFVVAFLFRFSVFATHCFGRAPFLRPYEMNAFMYRESTLVRLLEICYEQVTLLEISVWCYGSLSREAVTTTTPRIQEH